MEYQRNQTHSYGYPAEHGHSYYASTYHQQFSAPQDFQRHTYPPQQPHAHQFEHYPAVVQQQPPFHDGAPSVSCFVCGVKGANYGEACTRRCGWVANGGCPQCGRYTNAHSRQVFCGPVCAAESRQANWCGGCGVRQLAHGATSCGAAYCHHAALAASAQQQPHAAPHHRNPHRMGGSASGAPSSFANGRNFTAHSTLPEGDKVALALRHQLGLAPTDIAVVIKLGGSNEARKRYTANRCRVESALNDICGIGAAKYGHGGEGNEQRRFVPLRSECGASCVDGRRCGFPSCQACLLLDNNITRAVGSATVATYSTVKPALAQAARGSANFAAIAVCRVVVGHPLVVDATDESDAIPSLEVGHHHSAVVRHADFDVAHVTSEAGSDPAVDPMFLVILNPTTA